MLDACSAPLFVGLQFDLQTGPITAEQYPVVLGAILGLPPAAVSAVVQQYPMANYSSPDLAVAAVGTDAVFACNALQVDGWLANYVPTYAYEFNDPNAPEPFLPPVSFPYAAAHASELQYLFGVRANVPTPPLTASQLALSGAMTNYWSQFARLGNPNGLGVPWVRSHRSLRGCRSSRPPPRCPTLPLRSPRITSARSGRRSPPRRLPAAEPPGSVNAHWSRREERRLRPDGRAHRLSDSQRVLRACRGTREDRSFRLA